MRKLTFLFAFLLTLLGGTRAWAETVTADFNTNNSLPEGWEIKGSLDWDSDRRVGSSGYGLATSSAGTSNYLVTGVLTGDVSFYARRYSSSSSSGSSYYGYVYIYDVDDSGNLTGSALQTYSFTTYNSSWGNSAYTYSIGNDSKRIAIVLSKAAIDNVSGTKGSTTVDAPSMKVSATSYDFGLTTAGATTTFKITNNGNTDYTISALATNGFGTSLSTTTLVKETGTATLTVTMPSSSASGVVTISSSDDNIADYTINVSGTIRDPNKVYLDFADGQMPDGWTSVKVGSWAADWSVGTGYIGQSSNPSYTTTNYDAAFTSPKLVFAENETVLFESARYNNNTNATYVKVQYSTDGSTWVDCSSNFEDNIYGTWTQRSATVPTAEAKYIRFYGRNVYLRNIYGGELPVEPKMVVTQPASLSFGAISESTTKTFTISNTGLATLEGISISSSNSSAFVISNAPTSLAAGTSQEVTITMAANTVGNLSSDITVSATGMENVQFTVSGTVLPTGLSVIDFNDNALPARWQNTGWTFSDGAAYAAYNSTPYTMTTPEIVVENGDLFVIKAKLRFSGTSYYVTINGSSDNGATWTAYTKKLSSELNTEDYTSILLSDIPSTVNRLQFVGYYGYIDEIQGINYAPELSVTKESVAVSTPESYDFGECGANATVTYNFANAGAGTINITNVAITGDGKAAYSTNWTESVAAPFDLVITRTYDATRTEAQAAVVTVTTSDGDFVINVTGTDKAANAPELSVTFGGVAVATGDAADFGSQLQSAPAAKTYTITNSGTGTLTGTIATSDNTQFTVSETAFSLGASESIIFDVALVFDTNYGAKAATIIIHPTNDGLSDIVINATASTLDPEAWTEDFATGTLPTGWTQGTWTIGTYSYYENTSTMALAPSGQTSGTLITPCLSAKAGDVLTWDGYFNWYDEAMTVEYSSDDQATWTKIYDAYKAQDDGISTRYSHKAMSFTAPADGNYYLRFTSTYSNGVDNFAGFKLNLPDHIMAITASSIPTSGSYSPSMKATQPFTATVTVKESRGVAETNVVAKLYMGTDVIGTSDATDFAANESKQISITCTPTEAATGGVEMYIEVTYAGGTLTTTPETRYVAEFNKLELTETESKEITTGYSAVYDQVTLTRNFVAGWNTFVAPQAVNMSEFGDGAKAYSFTGNTNGVLSFTAVSSNSLNAATPYIIYIPSAMNNKVFTWNSPVIYSSYVGADNIKTTINDVTFQGTYAPITAGNLTGKYIVGTINNETKIAKAGTGASIKGFRAYFDTTSEARLTISFDDESGTTTGIGMIENGELKMKEVYNLQGQRVTNVKKGQLYIVDGQKVIIK